MSEELKYERVVDPKGQVFNVSTIRTLAGGGGNNQPLFSPFDEKSYLNETPWPFETMIFKEIGVAGQYHAPAATKAGALREHAKAVELIRSGGEFEGVGVQGFWGTPALTAEQWFAAHPRTRNTPNPDFLGAMKMLDDLDRAMVLRALRDPATEQIFIKHYARAQLKRLIEALEAQSPITHAEHS